MFMKPQRCLSKNEGRHKLSDYFLPAFSLLVLFFLVSCAHVISEQMRATANVTLTFPEVQADPERYVGTVVIWGGIIIETENRTDGTYIKVLQTPLKQGEVPRDAEASQGRFLVKHPDYLDPEIYRKGRKLSVAGEISGKETLPIGEITYTYPLLLAKEVYLWQEIAPVRVYPPPFYWGYWGYGAYWDWDWPYSRKRFWRPYPYPYHYPYYW
jgi:outer membrane lipoprotein